MMYNTIVCHCTVDCRELCKREERNNVEILLLHKVVM